MPLVNVLDMNEKVDKVYEYFDVMNGSCQFKSISCKCTLTSTIELSEMCGVEICPFIYWLSPIITGKVFGWKAGE